MCGICGIIHLDDKLVQESSIREMMRTMKHRGPDDEGVFIKRNIGLGFVRLSIIDLSYAGHQPMISDDGRYVIVFNGEIYNYIELKEKLKHTFEFNSNTDTEVLLASYIKWGKNCLDMLNGMFAFVILDTLSMDIFASRDRFGIKPFYYMADKNRLVFASDIPPLLSQLAGKPNKNNSIIYDFLAYNRTNHNNQTFFSDIFKLQHGHNLQVINNKITIDRWYDLPESVHKIKSDVYSSQSFTEDFSDSIELQLRSDVPVGTCLSGGLDSSSITSVVQKKLAGKTFHTFSAVYGKSLKGDESEFIELYANSGLNMHYTFPSSESLLNDIGKFNNALSEPVPNTSEYAEFKVMELAKEHCTVILNGQGADEIMAGYHYFFGYYFKDLLKKYKLYQFTSELLHYLFLHKSTLGIRSFGFAMFPQWFKNINTSFLDKEFVYSFSQIPNPIVDDFYCSTSLQDFLIKHFEYKFEHHLLWADKSGMYFSMETRFPFLDHHLVENTLASGKTIKNGWTKYLLRDSMKDIIPEGIRLRVDKTGYQTPEELWFSDLTFKEYFLDIVNSFSFREREYFSNTQCQKALNDYHKSSKYNREFWKWLSLELWMRQFID